MIYNCQFLHTLDNRFLPYSRSQFSRVIIPQKYEEVKHTVKLELEGAEYLSLTTDLWTDCQCKPLWSSTYRMLECVQEQQAAYLCCTC